ncbi:DNA methyltransferase [Aphanizomenon flos-aquae]|uniref:DNA methyltransferase n=1 Tax=Aphanizomenon flos-aquae TaxID=1176 RepID=UPI001F54B6FE|nr:DNA methyltransferase [Aphanizomenon flos-aquae]
MTNLVSKTIKSFIYMGCGVNKLIFGITGTEEPFVLDPFCGSGTTCIAARNLNRNYLGIEINPDYVNLANNRMEQSDSQQQELSGIFLF